MTRRDWHPRGTPTWPDWKTAPAGTRVENVRTGRTGTFVRARIGTAGSTYAIVDWDAHGRMPASRGRVVAPAFDLRPIDQPNNPKGTRS